MGFIRYGAFALAASLLLADAFACGVEEIEGKPVLDVQNAGELVAYFVGEPPEDGAPRRYGAEELWFAMAGDAPRLFQPSGEIFFSDWLFHPLSPGGSYVLLPQDRFGPYDIVRADELWDFLEGKQAAAFSAKASGDEAAVHASARWLSDTVGVFESGCCGDIELHAFAIDEGNKGFSQERLGGGAPSQTLKRLLTGAFSVAERRPASDTPSTLAIQEKADSYLSYRAAFGSRATWLNDRGCDAWSVSARVQQAPDDPSLEGLTPQPPAGVWTSLVCNGETVDEIFILDENTLLSRTPNGVAWLVWRRSAD